MKARVSAQGTPRVRSQAPDSERGREIERERERERASEKERDRERENPYTLNPTP